MNSTVRSLLMFVGVGALAVAVALFVIRREAKREAMESSAPTMISTEQRARLRQTAVAAAAKALALQLAEEKTLYETEKREDDLRELAELSHEMRLLRIDLQHRAALVEIDKKYPPEKP